MNTVDGANHYRSQIKEVGRGLLWLKERIQRDTSFSDEELKGEAIANAVLAFRHAEDAAMRLGKVLQAANGGESIYDNSGVVEQK